MPRYFKGSIIKHLQAVSFLAISGILLLGCGSGGGGGTDATNGAAPIASVAPAVSVGERLATLQGFVVADGLPTNAWFEYGTDALLTTRAATDSQPIGSGMDNVPINAQISGLAEGTKYYFRVCASNSKGEVKSDITSLTTASLGDPPLAATVAASAVGATLATLNGTVTPNGLATEAWFEYGTSSTLSTYTSTAHESVGAGAVSVSVDAALTGLTTGTTYYFRVVAENSQGIIPSNGILSFTPGAVPTVISLAATSVGATGATLNGNVTPNGLTTTAWFEYGTSSTLSTYTSTAEEPVGAGTTACWSTPH